MPQESNINTSPNNNKRMPICKYYRNSRCTVKECRFHHPPECRFKERCRHGPDGETIVNGSKCKFLHVVKRSKRHKRKHKNKVTQNSDQVSERQDEHVEQGQDEQLQGVNTSDSTPEPVSTRVAGHIITTDARRTPRQPRASIQHLACQQPHEPLDGDIFAIELERWSDPHFPCHFARSYPDAVRVTAPCNLSCGCIGAVHYCRNFQGCAITENERCVQCCGNIRLIDSNIRTILNRRMFSYPTPHQAPLWRSMQLSSTCPPNQGQENTWSQLLAGDHHTVRQWLQYQANGGSPIVSHVQPCTEPEAVINGRTRPTVWLCDGFGDVISSDNFYSRSWLLGIVMSYPVNNHHLMSSREGPKLCLTLSNVAHRLLLPNSSLLEHIFISDVFPYTGHPSVLGAPDPRNEQNQQAKQNQAERLLMSSPLVLVVSGASARDAFYRTICAHEHWQTIDTTVALGVPSCFVIISGRATLILFQPHPCLDRIGQEESDFTFGTRSAYVRSILNREQLFTLPTRSEIISESVSPEIVEYEEEELVTVSNQNNLVSNSADHTYSSVYVPLIALAMEQSNLSNRIVLDQTRRNTLRINHLTQNPHTENIRESLSRMLTDDYIDNIIQNVLQLNEADELDNFINGRVDYINANIQDAILQCIGEELELVRDSMYYTMARNGVIPVSEVNPVEAVQEIPQHLGNNIAMASAPLVEEIPQHPANNIFIPRARNNWNEFQASHGGHGFTRQQIQDHYYWPEYTCPYCRLYHN